jgi:hypothetical protein
LDLLLDVRMGGLSPAAEAKDSGEFTPQVNPEPYFQGFL